MAKIYDIADPLERKLLLQHDWRKKHPENYRAAMKRWREKHPISRSELERLRQENAQLKMENDFLRELWDLFREPEATSRMVQ